MQDASPAHALSVDLIYTHTHTHTHSLSLLQIQNSHLTTIHPFFPPHTHENTNCQLLAIYLRRAIGNVTIWIAALPARSYHPSITTRQGALRTEQLHVSQEDERLRMRADKQNGFFLLSAQLDELSEEKTVLYC